MKLKVQELCLVMDGQLVQRAKKELPIIGVSIDSREAKLSGKIFFAIQGKRLNGHDFIEEALKKGVAVLVVHSNVSNEMLRRFFSVSVIQVKDTLKALQNLSIHWREKIGFSVIGITGSVGKTTTKHFCFRLMEKFTSVQMNPKSFNNEYGVPLSLLHVREGTDFLIQEIGTSAKGEIQSLCQIARPDIVTVVQVGQAHIGNLGSEDEIAREKEQIYLHSSPKAKAVFNLDNPHTYAMYKSFQSQKSKKECLTFSTKNKKADVFLEVKTIAVSHLVVSGHFQGVSASTQVPIVGEAHIHNLMAGGCLALLAGLKPAQVWESLPFCDLPSGRNQWFRLSSGAKALFDAYNASPESVMALLDYFFSPVVKGKKILILGDFLELGSKLEAFQKKLASRLSQSEVFLIWFIGTQADSLGKALREASCSAKIYLSSSYEEKLAKKIINMLNPSFVLALKASRKMRMEKILQHLEPLDSENFLVY